MKKHIIILLGLGVTLSSCGISSHYSSSPYDDAIYIGSKEPSNVAPSNASNEKLIVLQEETKDALSKQNAVDTQKLYIANKQDSTQYIGTEESFEERLTKFDSPTYVVNLVYSDNWGYYPDFSSYYFFRNPWYFRYAGYGYPYNYWGFPYNNWGYPFSFGWYNPWYSYGYSPWYDPFFGMYDWWSPYYYGFNYGYYNPAWYYGGGYGHLDHNIISGRRRVDTDSRLLAGNSVRSSGSYIRRDANIKQVRGQDRFSSNDQNSVSNRSQSIYRRDASAGTSGIIHNTNVVSNRNSSLSTRSSNVSNPSNTGYRRAGSSVNNESGQTVKSSSSNTSGRSYNTGNSSYQRRSTSSNPEPASNRSSSTYSGSNGNSGNSSRESHSSGGNSGGSIYRR